MVVLACFSDFQQCEDTNHLAQVDIKFETQECIQLVRLQLRRT